MGRITDRLRRNRRIVARVNRARVANENIVILADKLCASTYCRRVDDHNVHVLTPPRN